MVVVAEIGEKLAALDEEAGGAVGEFLGRRRQVQRQAAHAGEQGFGALVCRNPIGEHARVELVFGILDARCETVGRVAGQHLDAGLAQYGPVIQFGGDDMDGAAGLGLARGQHGFVGVQALVLGQQRRVDVEAAALPVGDEFGGQ